MTELRATLIVLRLVIFILGLFIGIAYIAWAMDDLAGMFFSLFMAGIMAWAWIQTERDVKEQLKDDR